MTLFRGIPWLAIGILLCCAAASAMADESPQRTLFEHRSVQRELNLTDDQQKQVDEIVAEMRTKIAQRRKEAAAKAENEQEARTLGERAADTVVAEQGQRFMAVLDQRQATRFWEIGAQTAGPEVFNNNRVQRVLKLTDEQRQKMGEIYGAMEEELVKVLTDATLNIEERQRETLRIREGCRGKLLTVLTPQQRKDFDSLLGKPFDDDPLKPKHLRRKAGEK